MWWKLLEKSAEGLRSLENGVDPTAEVDREATLKGVVHVGPGAKICHGAYIEGPVWIGEGCLIGNNTMIRGPLKIGDRSIVGFGAELKNAIIGNGVAVGPQCYVADSIVGNGVVLGAQVRTSNWRIDKATIFSSLPEGALVDTGLTKLGCLIGAKAALGIQCIVYPGRIVAPGSTFEPRISIVKNFPAGRYTLKQELLMEPLL